MNSEKKIIPKSTTFPFNICYEKIINDIEALQKRCVFGLHT